MKQLGNKAASGDQGTWKVDQEVTALCAKRPSASGNHRQLRLIKEEKRIDQLKPDIFEK
jgi:hypothetical protein